MKQRHPIRNFDSNVPEYSYFPGESTSQTYHLRYIILLLLVFLFLFLFTQRNRTPEILLGMINVEYYIRDTTIVYSVILLG